MSPRCRSCSPVPKELRQTAGLLERRWTMATIYACSSGAVRFNEFRQSLPGVSPTTLSDRLDQLEAAGVRRVSLATSLYKAAITGLVAAAREIREKGTFGYLDGAIPSKELGGYMRH